MKRQYNLDRVALLEGLLVATINLRAAQNRYGNNPEKLFAFEKKISLCVDMLEGLPIETYVTKPLTLKEQAELPAEQAAEGAGLWEEMRSWLSNSFVSTRDEEEDSEALRNYR